MKFWPSNTIQSWSSRPSIWMLAFINFLNLIYVVSAFDCDILVLSMCLRFVACAGRKCQSQMPSWRPNRFFHSNSIIEYSKHYDGGEGCTLPSSSSNSEYRSAGSRGLLGNLSILCFHILWNNRNGFDCGTSSWGQGRGTYFSFFGLIHCTLLCSKG